MLATDGAMSDGAVIAIVTGCVTVTTSLVGFLTLWLKLKYGADKAAEAVVKAAEVEKKIDANTVITEEGARVAADSAKEAVQTAKEAKVATESIANKLNGALEAKIHSAVEDHDLVQEHSSRIVALENKMLAVQATVESVSKNLDSTRHEMRGHLQTITNQLTIIAGVNKTGDK